MNRTKNGTASSAGSSQQVVHGPHVTESKLASSSRDAVTRLVDARAQRYWPVLATLSIERPGSVPLLPVTSVRM